MQLPSSRGTHIKSPVGLVFFLAQTGYLAMQRDGGFLQALSGGLFYPIWQYTKQRGSLSWPSLQVLSQKTSG